MAPITTFGPIIVFSNIIELTPILQFSLIKVLELTWTLFSKIEFLLIVVVESTIPFDLIVGLIKFVVSAYAEYGSATIIGTQVLFKYFVYFFSIKLLCYLYSANHLNI